MAYFQFLSDNASKTLVGIEIQFRFARKVLWVGKNL